MFLSLFLLFGTCLANQDGLLKALEEQIIEEIRLTDNDLNEYIEDLQNFYVDSIEPNLPAIVAQSSVTMVSLATPDQQEAIIITGLTPHSISTHPTLIIATQSNGRWSIAKTERLSSPIVTTDEEAPSLTEAALMELPPQQTNTNGTAFLRYKSLKRSVHCYTSHIIDWNAEKEQYTVTKNTSALPLVPQIPQPHAQKPPAESEKETPPATAPTPSFPMRTQSSSPASNLLSGLGNIAKNLLGGATHAARKVAEGATDIAGKVAGGATDIAGKVAEGATKSPSAGTANGVIPSQATPSDAIPSQATPGLAPPAESLPEGSGPLPESPTAAPPIPATTPSEPFNILNPAPKDPLSMTPEGLFYGDGLLPAQQSTLVDLTTLAQAAAL